MRLKNGRWLYNEKEQNASRFLKFDVDATQRLACTAVGAQRCTHFKKARITRFLRSVSMMDEKLSIPSGQSMWMPVPAEELAF
ncbi:hypothetical protein SCP_0905650 [Sparassis crispa]|uniref:Uncharacterized protein n=1 Tax=Sparassis crispa TaxID=139825 RepID=A0A401GWT7_9APHY|nr:hypothetical protein SCP_0905650 [Sparassis crispa]GBE86685.1 hypothetical protein SCP_0905650 [Sparassis crispa]